MVFLSRLRLKACFWWSVHENGPKTYHEFLSRAEKHIEWEEASLDHEQGKIDLKPSIQPKDKRMDQKIALYRRNEKRDADLPRSYQTINQVLIIDQKKISQNFNTRNIKNYRINHSNRDQSKQPKTGLKSLLPYAKEPPEYPLNL